jgi:peptide/nickel transport system permease protein
MLTYIWQRLTHLIPVLFLVAVVVFVVFRLVPGDPALLVLGPDPDPVVLKTLRAQMRLDRSLPEQFGLWLADLARGDLGRSVIYERSIGPLVLERFVVTGELALAGLLVGTIVGVASGIVTAMRRGTWLDLAARLLALLGYCTPRYWLAVLLVFVCAVQLRLLPVSGYASPFADLPAHLRFLVLPTVTMALPIAAVQMRFLRSGVLDVLGRDYVRTARSKGLREGCVVRRHVLKNALIPLVTFVGLQAGYLLGGSVIVEQIFAWPGLGWLTIQAITQRDYAVVQGTVLLSAFVFVAINLLVDVGYAVLDPRIRYAGR